VIALAPPGMLQINHIVVSVIRHSGNDDR
jgi:hypothetical protein